MAIAYAASLSMMFVLGVFSSSVKQAIRRCVDFGEAKGLESSPVASSRGDVRVSTGESVASYDEQNDGVELAPGSSSTAACVPQEAADGVPTSSQPKETLPSACGLGLAVPTQLMSAAVSGLVAGACFSVVNRLFSRR